MDNNLSIRITDHNTGFDQTIELGTVGETYLGTLTAGESTFSPPAAANAGAAPSPRFVDNGDGTVTDTTTGLMWSKATLSDKEVSQHKAVEICADLALAGHDDWRLPSRVELLSLVDDTRHKPAIDTSAFPDTKSDWYWTGTEAAWASSCAWVVLFDYGGANDYDRGSSGGFVRAVRSVSAGQ